jgi:hypothetical protein
LFRLEERIVRKRALQWLSIAAALVLVLATVRDAQAQVRTRVVAVRPATGEFDLAQYSLVGNEAVRSELGVNDGQASKLQDLSEDVAHQRSEMMDALGSDLRRNDLSPQDREQVHAKLAKVNKAVSDKFRPKLETILNKDQVVRLREIVFQVAGPEALNDARVVGDLGLSNEQQDQIAAIDNDYGKKRLELFGGGEGEERRAKLLQEQLVKVTGILTKEQQTRFAKMRGKAFDASKMRGAFGRRGT